MSNPPEPIAIIGTGCRFPGGCNNPSKLWELLREPRDLLKEIPEDRFSADGFYHPQNSHHGTSNVKHSYLLDDDLRRFDAQFFSIKATEANSIDPQQRLLMETVYESLEAAGMSIKRLQGSDTAVYVGVMSADYTDLIGRDVETFPTYFATGTARSILSNRLSYFFDWHGPSMTIDTACSSSLIAMHQAVQTLRAGESGVAVVAGSNLILGPEQYIAESKLQMLSPTGRSRMWDANADGYARGEGVAAIVLKPLSKAIADHDHIECVIRETGVNQDGKTPGITMPSAAAQARLIRSTYSRVGLDISKLSDRPQYFEAHGTGAYYFTITQTSCAKSDGGADVFGAHCLGTPAGDPIEAEAISSAFYGRDLNLTPEEANGTLFVGSIKTVVGHTEGTAGLAAVIKASLSLQSGELPPNLLFDKLNPNITPFYQNLKILSAAQPWPKLPGNGARRISVNSFGFGGANCHAILESVDSHRNFDGDSSTGVAGAGSNFSPYIFSAATQSTLISMLGGYKEYLASKTQPINSITLEDLAWTLSSRRTTLACRTVIPAARSIQDLINKLDQAIQSPGESSEPSVRKPLVAGENLKVLGVFTGQGAQWPRMGADLIENSAAADGILQQLDRSLQSLPRHDMPSWSLRDQLLAPAGISEVGTASLSQPLCTAVQIMLVELLRAAGVQFSAVVGHSSGEIGAAYASGYLSAHDAIRIAYYRGLHLKSVVRKGAMLAVGTSYEDAAELCALPAFEGRVCVAASNSPSSVTLSGDAEAIEEIKVVLDEEKKFTRLLQVDRAYHSHHMQACAEAYTRSLEQCGIQSLTGNADADCLWVSSVSACNIADIPTPGGLGPSYWASNLVQPVRFSDALQYLLCDSSSGRLRTFDVGVEVGPHPALKGPVKQSMQEYAPGQDIPYTGVMTRDKNSVESFSMALGFMWKMFGDGVVDLPAYEKYASGRQLATQSSLPLKDLPTYPWDHERTFWHESRLSRAFRTRQDRPHQLLGRRVLDGTPGHMQWRNIFKRSEIGWLDGHQVQGQTVFPCAGYVSLCIEACLRACVDDGNIQSIELRDFEVGHAMVFDDEDSGLDATTILGDISRRENGGQTEVNARFSFCSTPNNDTLDMVSHANCQVHIIVGKGDHDILPPKTSDDGEYALLDVEEDRFYDALGKLGFGYSGPFRALKKLRRRLGSAQGLIQGPEDDEDAPLLVHPALLDSAIQSIMLAFCFPGDSMLRSIYLPTSIGRLIVNPMHCLEFSGKAIDVPFDATASVSTARSLSGDANIYSPHTGFSSKAIQLEGLRTRPLAGPIESTELSIFTELTWDVGRPDSETIVARTTVPELKEDLLFSLERVAYFYLRTLNDAIPSMKRMDLEWHQKRLFAYVDHVLLSASSGSSRFARAEWISDTTETIAEILDKYPENADLRLMRAVGENISAVIRGETTMLEHMVQDNKLNDFYVHAEGMPRYTAYLAAFASQIGHSHPHMHVLEIGAGTGGATKSFLKELDDQYASYTFTDISSGFFEKAAEVFSSSSAKMAFRVLDIEKDIVDQGFAEGSFDVIIASLVLHATRDLTQTLQNVRRLLKPGGYLLLLEITENEQMRFGLLFGGLPGWWLGYDDGRALSPCVGLEEWQRLLKQTGFSGIDTVVPHEPKLPVPLSVIVSQAIDENVSFLRQPLDQSNEHALIPRLVIIGGGGSDSAALAKDIQGALTSHCRNIKFVSSPLDIEDGDLVVGGSVLCLSDIDEPVFKSLTASKLQGLQKIFRTSTNVLWVTRGVRAGDPYARMVVGLGRTVVLEMLHLRLQFLDLDLDVPLSPSAIAESLLRLEVTGTWDEDAHNTALRPLHNIEPEVHLSDTGKLFVPRFKLNQAQNNRYKAARRSIIGHVDVNKSPVELYCNVDDGSYKAVEINQHKGSLAQLMPLEETMEINVIYSINRSVRIAKDCHVFAILGNDSRSGELVLAVSPRQASRVVVPKAFILSGLDILEDDRVDALETFYFSLLGRAALIDVSAGTRVIAMHPDGRFARTVERLSADKGASFMHISAQQVHPKAPRTEVLDILQPMVVPGVNIHMIDLEAKHHYITEAIAQHASRDRCQTISRADITYSVGHIPKSDGRNDVRAALAEARYSLQHQRVMQQAGEMNKANDSSLQTLSLPSILNSTTGPQGEFIVSWKYFSDKLPVSIQTIDTHIGFQGDKTYWLVGLTGGLGLSLCDWIAQKGARYIAITSRNPKINEGFLRKMKAKGVTLQTIAADVCDRDSLHNAYSQIKQQLPPIAGVVQGAMVLHDTVFLDLDMERVNKVMKPKVQGSLLLEEIFHHTPLDFFVFFSSMACVTGNPGQSIYASANMFMSGLAAQRRQRGLNASVVHIGAIFGNGYVTRELTLAQQEFLQRVGNLWLSEQDFRTLFAEAIYAGQAQHGRNTELSTGLMMIEDSEEFQNNITWFNNPMFQHCVKPVQTGDGLENTGKSRRGVLVKAQLQDAISHDDVRDIIYEAFSAKLQSSLQVEEGRQIKDLTADNLGIDSLVAVDIRSWFIKELQVEIPVLKILSGATVGELLAKAQELLPPSLIPHFDPEVQGLSNKSKPKAQKPNATMDKVEAPASSKGKQSNSASTQQRVLNGTSQPTNQLDVSLDQSTKETLAPDARTPAVNQGMPAQRPETFLPRANNSQTPPEVQSSPAKTPYNAESVSHGDVSITDQDASKLSSSSTSWSEISDAELGPRRSETAPTESLASGIDDCLGKNRIFGQNMPVVVRKAPLAFAQSRFWFLEQFLEDRASALNITLSIDIQGSLDVEKLKTAVRLVGQRHEALRTRFVTGDDEDGVTQEILASSHLVLDTFGIKAEAEADEWHRALAEHKYELSKGENMRIILLQRSSSSFRLLIGYHHINMDGISLEVVLKELQTIYDSQRPPNIRDILQYPDFAEMQRREYQSGQWKESLAFWKEEFGGQAPPVLPLLPLSKTQTRTSVTAYSSNTATLYLDSTTVGKIQSTCSKLKVNPFHFHLTVFYTLLTRLLDVEDLCIGISSANRQAPGSLQSVGLYLNLLPLLLKSAPRQTFANAVKTIRDKSLRAFGNSAVPFDVIVNEVGDVRTTSRSPLFQVLVNYRPGVSERRQFCGCESKIAAFEQGQTAYDLTLDILENPGGDCRVILGGQSVYYGEHEMAQLRDMYQRLLATFSGNQETRLSTPSLYKAEDVKAAIELGRGSIREPHWPATIIHRIDQMTKSHGNKTALRGSQNISLTYTQMADRVDALCGALSSYGPVPIKHGSKVGFFLSPSVDWVCCLLAVLRLGAIYVPLDATAGMERLHSIVRDCNPDLILTDGSTEEGTHGFDALMTSEKLFNVDTVKTGAQARGMPVAAEPASVAALMYTSGSTGTPKGIVMKHESFRNSIETMMEELSYTEGCSVTLQQSSYSFDMSLCQIFLALSMGGALYVVPKELRADPEAISHIIAKEGISNTTATPSELASWIRYGNSQALAKSDWRMIQSGGEPIGDSLIESLRQLGKHDLRLVDCYGPTEVTFCCHSKEVNYYRQEADDTAGTLKQTTNGKDGFRIWTNCSVYILDAHQRPVPAGVYGEIAIGGSGVVAGYLHNELDARGFRRDSWASNEFIKSGWARLHRTGDTGRLSPDDGSLILGPRVAGDAQIKLRGIRIDLTEIESAIVRASEGTILEAAVILRESKAAGTDYLVAFGVPAAGSQPGQDLSGILDRLALPRYMLPGAIFPLEKLSTNSSGKVDRVALKSLALPQELDPHVQLANEGRKELSVAETTILSLWKKVIPQDVLSQHVISSESDFFHVGGNSMLSVRLRTAVAQTLGATVSIFQLFERSTLGDMAVLLVPHLAATGNSSLMPLQEEHAESQSAQDSGFWDLETSVPASLTQIRITRRFFGSPSAVVLTGSTGFLGQAILRQLLQGGVVERIHCLAVRREVETLSKELFSSPKVVIHRGDLSLPHFGLEEEALAKIFSEVHAVIHNGADVSFAKSYASLKPVNVEATKALVRLSLPYHLSFHYVSTASLIQLTGQEAWGQQSVKGYPPPPPAAPKANGYISTKWACERYLEKISDHCGLPIWIHRPSAITGPGAPDTDLMTNLLRFARLTRAIPDVSDTWSGWLDLVAVERVAVEITDELYEDYSWPGTVKYLYESGDEVIPLSDLRGVLERETKAPVEVLDMDEWTARAAAQGMSPLLCEYLRGVADTPLVFGLLEKEEGLY
ncbi:uncharacterized protein PG998_010711 [Apiospora kogelbergensis]|uniref:uncharacterized protein n=1 Tax=Apiospora kogelbergensis TaxID=1337665 RepID=UPI0031308659